MNANRPAALTALTLSVVILVATLAAVLLPYPWRRCTTASIETGTITSCSTSWSDGRLFLLIAGLALAVLVFALAVFLRRSPPEGAEPR
jgi:hypothetical protein